MVAPRKYGQRITPQYHEENFPVTETTLFIYGKQQRVRLQAHLALARSFNAMSGYAGWCQIWDDAKQIWPPIKLIVSNETNLSAQDMVILFARRWSIEPLFHNIKRWWGCKDMCLQTRPVLELWMQMRSCALACRATRHRWLISNMVKNAICRTFLLLDLLQEVPPIPLAVSALTWHLPEIALIALISGRQSISFELFFTLAAVAEVGECLNLSVAAYQYI